MIIINLPGSDRVDVKSSCIQISKQAVRNIQPAAAGVLS